MKLEEFLARIISEDAVDGTTLLKLALQIKPVVRYEEYDCMPEYSRFTTISSKEDLVVDIMRHGKRLPSDVIESERHYRYQQGYFNYVEQGDIKDETFLSTRPICKATKLIKIADIETLHLRVMDNKGLVPTLQEVLVQIPQQYIKDTVAFEIYQKKNPTSIFASRGTDAICQRAKVRLFRLPEGEHIPHEVENAPVKMSGNTYTRKQIEALSEFENV